MENPFLGLAHIALFTSDRDKTVGFYTKALGFEIVHDIIKEPAAGPIGFYPLKMTFLRLNNLYMEIMEPACREGYVHTGVRGAIDHIGIQVSDLNEAVRRLRAYGLNQDFGENTGDFYTGIPVPRCSLTGPEGEVINLYQMDNVEHFSKEGI